MKKDIKQYAFFMAFLVKIIIILCQKITIIAQISNYLNYFVLLVLFIVFFMQIKNYKTKELFLITALIIIFGVSAFFCRDTILLQLLLFAICYKNIKLEKFLKFSLLSKIAILLIVIILWKVGLIDEVVTQRIGGNLIRHSWGLSHPNGLGLILFSICCDMLCLHYKKIKIYDIVFLIMALLISIFICNSRAAQIGIVVLLICALVIPKLEKKSIFTKTVVYLPIVLPVIALLLTILYSFNYSWIQKIDEILSSRVFYANSFLNYYGVNLFGNNFIYYGNSHSAPWFFALDCGYMFLLIKFGIVATVTFIYLIINAINKTIKTKNYAIFVYLIPFLFYGLMEQYVLYFQYNTILIYCVSLIFMNFNKSKEE